MGDSFITDHSIMDAGENKARPLLDNWNNVGHDGAQFSDKPIQCDGKCKEAHDAVNHEKTFEVHVFFNGEAIVTALGLSGGIDYTVGVHGELKSGSKKVNGHTVYYKDVFVPDKVFIKDEKKIDGKVKGKVEGAGSEGSLEGGLGAKMTDDIHQPWTPANDVPGIQSH